MGCRSTDPRAVRTVTGWPGSYLSGRRLGFPHLDVDITRVHHNVRPASTNRRVRFIHEWHLCHLLCHGNEGA